MRLQTGEHPPKMAVISVEWEDEPGSDTAVRETIESTMDRLLAALQALDVKPTIEVVMQPESR
jgi:hypothetical protein